MNEPGVVEPPVESGRARNVLLRRLIDYVAMPASRVAPQDRSMGGDILLDMLFHSSDEERLLCARRLATMREAPRRLIRYLAQCDFPIAEPLLRENPAFSSSDLCNLIEKVSPEHRRVIAQRKTVEPVVCDQLARVGELEAVLDLLNNKGADLSEHAIDLLISRSRTETEICSALVHRLELRPAQGMAMFWWSDEKTRRKILSRFAADRAEMIEMCSDVFAMAAEENWQDPVARKTLQLIERRQRNRAAIEKSQFESLEEAITTASVAGTSPEYAQEIGYLAGIKPVTVAKILEDLGGEGLAVICKATGLKRKYLQLLWTSLRRPLETEEGEPTEHFRKVQEVYDILSVAKAQTTLRYWNWSLSSAFSPTQVDAAALEEDEANDETAFSSARRTARLVFGTS